MSIEFLLFYSLTVCLIWAFICLSGRILNWISYWVAFWISYWKTKKRARIHFKQTERFRRDC